jgi:DNA-binding MarR family transcriptional regulator
MIVNRAATRNRAADKRRGENLAVLRLLSKDGDPSTIDLAKRMGWLCPDGEVDRWKAGRIIDRLARAGLIERSRTIEHGRVYHGPWTLTDAGKSAIWP